jgi:hypothetical protein
MQPTRFLLAPSGFIKRSTNEFARAAQIGMIYTSYGEMSMG